MPLSGARPTPGAYDRAMSRGGSGQRAAVKAGVIVAALVVGSVGEGCGRDEVGDSAAAPSEAQHPEVSAVSVNEPQPRPEPAEVTDAVEVRPWVQLPAPPFERFLPVGMVGEDLVVLEVVLPQSAAKSAGPDLATTPRAAVHTSDAGWRSIDGCGEGECTPARRLLAASPVDGSLQMVFHRNHPGGTETWPAGDLILSEIDLASGTWTDIEVQPLDGPGWFEDGSDSTLSALGRSGIPAELVWHRDPATGVDDVAVWRVDAGSIEAVDRPAEAAQEAEAGAPVVENLTSAGIPYRVTHTGTGTTAADGTWKPGPPVYERIRTDGASEVLPPPTLQDSAPMRLGADGAGGLVVSGERTHRLSHVLAHLPAESSSWTEVAAPGELVASGERSVVVHDRAGTLFQHTMPLDPALAAVGAAVGGPFASVGLQWTRLEPPELPEASDADQRSAVGRGSDGSEQTYLVGEPGEHDRIELADGRSVQVRVIGTEMVTGAPVEHPPAMAGRIVVATANMNGDSAFLVVDPDGSAVRLFSAVSDPLGPPSAIVEPGEHPVHSLQGWLCGPDAADPPHLWPAAAGSAVLSGCGRAIWIGSLSQPVELGLPAGGQVVAVEGDVAVARVVDGEAVSYAAIRIL